MSLILQGLEFFIGTQYQKDADTESDVFLMYISRPGEGRAGHAWMVWELNIPDYRERRKGSLDYFSLSFNEVGGTTPPDMIGFQWYTDPPPVGPRLNWLRTRSGTANPPPPPPPGYEFESWEHVRVKPFYLRITGADMWRFDRYLLFGRFLEWFPEDNRVVNRGSYLLAHNLEDGNLDGNLSWDPSEGSRWHQILINGPIPTAGAI
jgi:hypothetical protein